MAFPAFPVEGGCRCGAVRFVLTQPPRMEAACHCRGCQRMSASAFSTTIMTSSDGFRASGETVRGGAPSEVFHHHHCAACKSWVFTTMAFAPAFVNVRATLLDDPSWFSPWMETQTAEKLPWASTGAQRSFDRFPDMSEYPKLFAGYLADRG